MHSSPCSGYSYPELYGRLLGQNLIQYQTGQTKDLNVQAKGRDFMIIYVGDQCVRKAGGLH